MAKQSFVTGQVLTAQQVNDLQTNDFNQTVSAKTASYTLVAADKGTRITMSSTSATTITVNTGLFAAGDTLFIQNLNTGVCTITAGTATVDTSASLALAQHEGGTLYFTSAGVSTFFKAAGAAPSSGGMTLISTTTLSGLSTAITSIPSTYNSLQISWELINLSANDDVKLLPNNTANTFSQIYMQRNDTTNALGGVNLGDLFITPNGFKSANTDNAGTIIIDNYASATAFKPFYYYAHSKAGAGATNNHVVGGGVWASNTAISSLYFTSPSSISAGTVRLYGVK
jgi:hypothetical protein